MLYHNIKATTVKRSLSHYITNTQEFETPIDELVREPEYIKLERLLKELNIKLKEGDNE